MGSGEIGTGSIAHLIRAVSASPASASVPALGPNSSDLWNAYTDLLARHDRLLTLAQTKDWGFAHDERVDQLERAITGIARILTSTDVSRVEQGAAAILTIIQGVMPDLIPIPP